MASSSAHIYKFGDCYLNTVERRIFKKDTYLDITSKSYDILLLLVKKHGKIVTKDEILSEVWSNCFVEEGNLTVYVSKLRKVLDVNRSNSFIETVTGVGYRFVSKVQSFSEDEWEKLTVDKEKAKKNNALFAHIPTSIAVLPLTNENGSQEIDYFTDGLTEGIINELSSIPELRVLARNTVFRYKDVDVDFQAIGKKMNVQNILTGRLRIIQNNLIIGIELIKTDDGTQIWGTQINHIFEDIFEAQKEIIKIILEKLK